MIKYILTFVFCLMPLIASAQDYWVYIRTYDKPTVDYNSVAQGTYGRSKKGDIIDIRPVNSTTNPSEISQKEWAIVKVNGLTKEDITKYKKIWQEPIGTKIDSLSGETEIVYKRIADRRYKLDIDILNLKKGIYPNVRPFSLLKSNISEKHESILTSYLWRYRRYAYLERPLKIVMNKIIPKVFAETISTINKAGEDYDTLTLWEDAVDGDLVTETRQETAECYDDQGDLDDRVLISGSITNSSFFMKVTVPVGERHNGTPSSGFTINPSTGGNVIQIQEPFTVIEWVVITSFSGVAIFADVSQSENLIIAYVIIKGADGTEDGIRFTGSRDNTVYNCIVIDTDFAFISTDQVDPNKNTFYNCTAFSSDDGFTLFDVDIDSYNNASFDNNIDFRSAGGGGTFNNNNCASSDSTADNFSGANNIVNKVSADNFVATGSDNLHVKDESADIFNTGNGSVPKATFTDDIDAETRPATDGDWDIGADEFIAVAAGVIKTLNGVIWANIKTINGVAVGSIKTYNGKATQ